MTAGYSELHDTSMWSLGEAAIAETAQKLVKSPGLDKMTFSSLNIANLFLKNNSLLTVLPTKLALGFVPLGVVSPDLHLSQSIWSSTNDPSVCLASCIGNVVLSYSTSAPGLAHSSHIPSPSAPFLPMNFT